MTDVADITQDRAPVNASGEVPQRPWLFRALRHWGVEVLAVVVVVFGGFTALGHIATTGWSFIFMYQGDSIVLPLIEQSIHRGEPFEWVFSSQMFIFPEGLLYALSSIPSDDPRVVLTINTLVNLVALYALLRVNAHFLARHSRHRFLEICVSLIATGIYGVYVLLEPAPTINSTAIATLFLLTTYYYGAILVGLATTAGIFWLTDTFGAHLWVRRRVVIFSVVIGGMITIATISNALVIFQVVAPIFLAVLVLWFAGRIPARMFLVLSAVLLGAGLLGFGLRHFFAVFLQRDVGNYLALSQVPDTVLLFGRTFVELLQTGGGTLKLLLSVGLVLVSIVALVLAIFWQARPRMAGWITTAEFFLAAFVSISAISLVAGAAITGQLTTRYLVPAFVFPLLIALAIGISIMRRMLAAVERAELRRNLARFTSGVVVMATVLVIGYGAASIPSVASMVRGDGFTLNKCLDDYLGDSKANGVTSFGLSRPIALYGTQKGSLLQVDEKLRVFGWMNNLAPYHDKDFSYVVLSNDGVVTRKSIAKLGTPKAEIACSAGYTIVDYAGTPGEKTLTDLLHAKVDSVLRQKGWLAGS